MSPYRISAKKEEPYQSYQIIKDYDYDSIDEKFWIAISINIAIISFTYFMYYMCGF